MDIHEELIDVHKFMDINKRLTKHRSEYLKKHENLDGTQKYIKISDPNIGKEIKYR